MSRTYPETAEKAGMVWYNTQHSVSAIFYGTIPNSIIKT